MFTKQIKYTFHLDNEEVKNSDDPFISRHHIELECGSYHRQSGRSYVTLHIWREGNGVYQKKRLPLTIFKYTYYAFQILTGARGAAPNMGRLNEATRAKLYMLIEALGNDEVSGASALDMAYQLFCMLGGIGPCKPKGVIARCLPGFYETVQEAEQFSKRFKEYKENEDER